MSLKHGLLGLLNYSDMTGYDLDKTFRNSLSISWNATTSQVYRELSTMESLGWLNAKEVLQSGKPNKKIYHVTEEGKAELQKWLLEDHIKDELSLRHPFFLQMFFAGENSKEDNIRLINGTLNSCKEMQEYIERSEREAEYYSEKVADSTKSMYWTLTSMLGKFYCNSFIDWAERALIYLEKGNSDVFK